MLVAAEKRLGVPANRLLTIPDKPEDAEGWGKIYAAIGRPETIEGYGVELAEGATDADKAFIDKFVEKAHAAGASKAVVESAIEVLNEAVAQALKDEEEATKARAEACRAEVKKVWGAKTEIYDQEITKLIEDLGGKDAIEALNNEGLGSSPTLLKLLAKVCDLRSEQGDLPGAGNNRQDRGMTPDQARAARMALEADSVKGVALRDRNHPQHDAVMAERKKLLDAESGKAA